MSLCHTLIIKYFTILGLITYRTKLQFVSLLWTDEFGQSTSLLYMQLKEKIESLVYMITNLRQEKIISHYPLLSESSITSSTRYSWFSGKQLNADIDPFRRPFHWNKLPWTFNGQATYSLHQIYFTIVYACANAINIVAGNIHNLVIPQSEHNTLLFPLIVRNIKTFLSLFSFQILVIFKKDQTFVSGYVEEFR